MAKPITNLLKRALKKVERGWTQGPFAVDREGRSVSVKSPAACRWCLDGALMAAAGGEGDNYQKARDFIIKAINDDRWISWNEEPGRTKRQVIAAFKRAIKLADKAAHRRE